MEPEAAEAPLSVRSEPAGDQAPTYLGGRAGTPGQGPFMALALKVQQGRIVDVEFRTHGCPTALACGRWLSGCLVGKTLEEAASVGPGEITAGVGGLPLGKEFNVTLAADALQGALQGSPDQPK